MHRRDPVIEIGYRVAGFVVEKGVNKLKTKH